MMTRLAFAQFLSAFPKVFGIPAVIDSLYYLGDSHVVYFIQKSFLRRSYPIRYPANIAREYFSSTTPAPSASRTTNSP